MLRRVLVSVALATCAAGTSTFAAERATFILVDGERQSGTLVSRFGPRENLINDRLNLVTYDGREMTFPVNQVAVIDFVGARPPAAELDALPPDNRMHVLVLRNGSFQPGRFMNLIGGDL